MYSYYFPWKNNPKRETLFGRCFKILVRSKSMNSVLVELENGQCEVISRNAIRKIKKRKLNVKLRRSF